MRRFVVIGQRALASADFLLDDLAGTSGRLDVLLRALRAGLMVSHGLRKDTIVYLVLLGGERAPRTLRFDGAAAQFLRPEERSLATLAKKVLITADEIQAKALTPVRPGISVADAGLSAVLADLDGATPYVLEEGGPDIREAPLDLANAAFFLGDHLGFDAAGRAELAKVGAAPLGLGPVSVHVEDAVTIVANELDRRTPSP
ncbi:MAG: tRNA (pseudouridine(54)-N(1))-methyltransferase TrmY [Polyangiaceae bacterium]